MRFVEFKQSQTSPLITGLKEDEKRHEDHK